MGTITRARDEHIRTKDKSSRQPIGSPSKRWELKTPKIGTRRVANEKTGTGNILITLNQANQDKIIAINNINRVDPAALYEISLQSYDSINNAPTVIGSPPNISCQITSDSADISHSIFF